MKKEESSEKNEILDSTVKEGTSKNKETIITIWGMTFRTVFYLCIGFFGYFLFDPPTISDVPFSELTFNMLFRNIGAIVFVIACIVWFFDFPQKYSDDDNPYDRWAWLGGLIVVIMLIGVLYLI